MTSPKILTQLILFSTVFLSVQVCLAQDVIMATSDDIKEFDRMLEAKPKGPPPVHAKGVEGSAPGKSGPREDFKAPPSDLPRNQNRGGRGEMGNPGRPPDMNGQPGPGPGTGGGAGGGAGQPQPPPPR